MWRAHVRMRGIALFWQEETTKRVCAADGSGRAADLAVIADMDACTGACADRRSPTARNETWGGGEGPGGGHGGSAAAAGPG